MSFNSVKNMSSEEKIKQILEIVKKGDLVMIEGRLSSDEELSLTSNALSNVSKKFSGVEIAFLGRETTKNLVDRIKNTLIKLIAKDRFGITVVGPSKQIKEIKMNPDKLEILLK